MDDRKLDKGAVRVFFSYSHKDEGLRDKLASALMVMVRQQLIVGWHDRKITPGNEWAGQIQRELGQAQVVLLLFSPDFIASDYCYDTEADAALKRQTSAEC